MTLVYSCIAPHGGEIIPQLAPKSVFGKFAATRQAMRLIGQKIRDHSPHTIVIASPHNLRLLGKIAVVTTEYSSGTLKGSSKKSVFLRARCDRKFSMNLVEASERLSLPVVGANYAVAEGPGSDMQMDWGTLVPLWFVLPPRRKHSPRIVIVAPSREIPLRVNFQFGQLLGRMMSRDRKNRFVFIASADQAHAHSRSGPYGFSPAAAKYDRIVMDRIKKNSLTGLLRLNSSFVERAKPDSLWQMTMLAGVTDVVRSSSRLLSYQIPTYYGMACAEFVPVQNSLKVAKSN